MNASFFMLATVLATQTGNQVSGTITNNTDIVTGMPSSMVTPKGNGNVSGPATLYNVYSYAGDFNANNVFVPYSGFPNGPATASGLDSNKNFNWLGLSFFKPNFKFIERGQLILYQNNPPIFAFQVTADKVIE